MNYNFVETKYARNSTLHETVCVRFDVEKVSNWWNTPTQLTPLPALPFNIKLKDYANLISHPFFSERACAWEREKMAVVADGRRLFLKSLCLSCC